MIVQKGDKAVSFNLRNQKGERVDSTEVEGRILLSFHPLAFTKVCSIQMLDLEFNFDRIKDKNVTPFGISVDAHPSKSVWADSMGISKLEVLADFNPKGELAEKLGIYVEKAGISERAVVLMDQDQIIWSKLYEKKERPDIEEIIAHLED